MIQNLLKGIVANKLYLLVVSLFVFRLVYGLFSQFWFADELQIYLLGLKYYTTDAWPYYGPDLVYTNTQISGALQSLLVGVPLFIAKLPEAPIVLLNILSFLSLAYLVKFIQARIPSIPKWMVWCIVMTTPWAMYYSTRVVNPSYALVFSIPFFIAAVDLLPIYKEKFQSTKISFWLLGFCTLAIMQLHMSWVMLLPYTGLAFLFGFKKGIKNQFINLFFYLLGAIIASSTLIPTLLLDQSEEVSVATNIVFNKDNWSNLPIIALRYFSFAGNEIAYVLGGSTQERIEVVSSQIWMAPFTIVLLVMGFLQVGIAVFFLFFKKVSDEFKKVKLLTVLSIVLLYFSFFFSIKGPSSHTFYILFPLSIIYLFYCYDWLVRKKDFVLKYLKVMIVCSVFFHIGLGLYNYKNVSLYKDRDKAVEAISKKDYTILGARRSDNWGYGY